MSPAQPYDALLVVSFGGPERPDDVIPFLENVLRGKNVPRERMLEVADHYLHFGGKSPINAQVGGLIAALCGLAWAGIEAMRGRPAGGTAPIPLGTMFAVAALGWLALG